MRLVSPSLCPSIFLVLLLWSWSALSQGNQTPLTCAVRETNSRLYHMLAEAGAELQPEGLVCFRLLQVCS